MNDVNGASCANVGNYAHGENHTDARAEKRQWVLCPRCGAKTRLQILRETELKSFPLFCPKCRRESMINVKNFMLETREMKETSAAGR